MDRLEAVEKLAKLRDAGILTESEYLQQKNLVIGATSIVPRSASIDTPSNRLQRMEDVPTYQLPRDVSPQIHIHNTNSQHVTAPVYYLRPEKSILVSYLLWFFLGGFGAHRFYLGRPATAIILMILNFIGLTTLVLGVGIIFIAVVAFWLFIDLFLIPGMANGSNRMVAG